MVRIRFRRVGARSQPSFRIVAADKESPRDGRYLEVLGSYNPRTHPSTVRVDEARLFHWMKNGAQPSDAVQQTLRSIGTWERWERFKQGESLEILIPEAEAAIPEVDPRTRRDDQIGQRSKKSKKVAQAAESPSEGEAKPAEAEAPVEPAPKDEQAEPAEAEAPLEAAPKDDEAEPAEAEAPVEAAPEDEQAEPAEAEAQAEGVLKAEAEDAPEAEAGDAPEAETDDSQASSDSEEPEAENA